MHIFAKDMGRVRTSRLQILRDKGFKGQKSYVHENKHMMRYKPNDALQNHFLLL